MPFTIAFHRMPRLCDGNMRCEPGDAAGFDAEPWRFAADDCLRHRVNLEEGLRWARNAVSKPGIGVGNLAKQSTLARLQEANRRPDDAKRSMERAMALPGTTPVDIPMHGRALQDEGRERDGLEVIKSNAKRFPGRWPVHVGFARGYAGTGDDRTALVHARKALALAPDEGNRRNLEGLIKPFEERAAAKPPPAPLPTPGGPPGHRAPRRMRRSPNGRPAVAPAAPRARRA
uniref:Tetratricopeptide repeat protein n=1 Tax=Eiseniibacteriota bacterium TaxID=2212470 RepID=A0A832MLE7_UNCEI